MTRSRIVNSLVNVVAVTRRESSNVILLLFDLLLVSLEVNDGLLGTTAASGAGAGRYGYKGGLGLLALDGASSRDLQGDLVTGGVGLGSVTLLGDSGSLESGLYGLGLGSALTLGLGLLVLSANQQLAGGTVALGDDLVDVGADSAGDDGSLECGLDFGCHGGEGEVE